MRSRPFPLTDGRWPRFIVVQKHPPLEHLPLNPQPAATFRSTPSCPILAPRRRRRCFRINVQRFDSSGEIGKSNQPSCRSLLNVDPFCRKGFSPSGEPWCRDPLHSGKASLGLRSVETDIRRPVAHLVATSREIPLGNEDLQKGLQTPVLWNARLMLPFAARWFIMPTRFHHFEITSLPRHHVANF